MMQKNNNIKDLAIWGHPPPPFGGMTVHISRLVPKLQENNISYNLYSFNRQPMENEDIKYANNIKWLWRLISGNVENVHYIITVRPWVRFIAVLFGQLRKKKIILRIGGASLHKGAIKGSSVTKYISKYAVRNASAVIGVNDDICRLAIELGAQSNRVHKIPGFIIPKYYSQIQSFELQNFINNRWPLIITTGLLVKAGQYDMYGVGMSIEMIKSLIIQYPKIGLVIFSQCENSNSPSATTNLYYELNSLKLQNSILIVRGTFDFLPAIELCDVFVRPTLSDGDANSIREALYLGTPVVTSDCVNRPEGVNKFKTGDLYSYIQCIKMTLENMNEIKHKLKKIKSEDNSKAVIEVIKELLD
jgi:glycosyltransferase involved in cell wall biosynthesis